MDSAPQTIRQQITNQIRNNLVSGAFPAGTTLRESELASRLGVSRGPVRDAFIQLSHEGFLEYQANRGVTVRQPPDPADREFVTDIRRRIESYVIAKGIKQITEDSVKSIESALARLKSACEKGDATEIAYCDIAFHESILIACGGEDLVGSWRLLCSRMLLAYTRHANYGQTYQEHADILEALKKKSSRAAIAAIKANIK